MTTKTVRHTHFAEKAREDDLHTRTELAHGVLGTEGARSCRALSVVSSGQSRWKQMESLSDDDTPISVDIITGRGPDVGITTVCRSLPFQAQRLTPSGCSWSDSNKFPLYERR